MPRTSRASVGGMRYHVINRGNRRADVFHKEGGYAPFVKVPGDVCVKVPVRPLAHCLMPNHFHLVLWPENDGDLNEAELTVLRGSVNRGSLFVTEDRTVQTGVPLGLESTLRPRRRPSKQNDGASPE